MASPWASGGAYAKLAGFASTSGEKGAWGKAFRTARSGGKGIKGAATVADKSILSARRKQQQSGKSAAIGKGGGIKHRPSGTPRGGQFY